MSKDLKEFEEERQNLLLFIWQNRKVILFLTGFGMVTAIVISLFMTPIFKSTAIVFPAATSTVSFSEQRNAKAAAMDFGEEEQAEQLVQILQSARIRDRIVSEYKLMEHYEITPTDVNKNFKLNAEYTSNFSFTRTRYGSIQIDVLDRDPILAAEMANRVVELIDTVKNQMVAERTIPAFNISKRKRDQLLTERDNTLKELDSLAELGVMSLEARTNLFQAYVDAKNPDDRSVLKRAIDANMQHGSRFDGLEMIRNEKIMQLEEFKLAYDQAESDANAVFNHKFVVENAVVADRKDKPKRMIIVLLATIGTFVFSVFFLLVMERLKTLKRIAQ